MKMMKKGISPLIATVLIIGFTVALAAIIMTWGTTFSKGIQKSTEATTNEQMACAQDVQISLASACVNGNDIQMTIKNDGSKDIKSMAARFYTGASVVGSTTVATAATLTIPAYGIITPAVDVTNIAIVSPVVVAANVKYVEIIPVIQVGEKEITCTQSVENFGDSTFTDKLDVC